MINKTNSTISVIKSLPYSTFRTLAKRFGKLILRKLVLAGRCCTTKREIFIKPMKFNQHGDVKLV